MTATSAEPTRRDFLYIATGTVAAVATSAAAIAAVSWVALTKVVVRAAPFQRTLEPLTKLVPVTVSVDSP